MALPYVNAFQMDDIIAACMSYEGSLCDVEDFPKSDLPVHILGKQYSTETELEEIRSDVCSRIWMTYRRNFPQIIDTTFTSDKGWGCMLRCGQMVVAEALIRHCLGRDWRWSPEDTNDDYLKIISLFEDDNKQPFSLHKMVAMGADDGKKVGEWYGPNTVAHVLRKLAIFETWSQINVNVVMDNVFIVDEIRQSSFNSSNNTFRPMLLFIPLRLGVAEINPIYIAGLKKCLKMPQSLGIIGGKPNHALYFVGFMGDELVYLDPHTTQEAGALGRKATDEEKECDVTYHCFHAQRMPVQYLDPSLALCFLCSSEKDFGDLCNRLRQEIVDGEDTSLLEICATRPDYLMDTGYELDNSAGATGPGLKLEDHQFDSDEDFEILE